MALETKQEIVEYLREVLQGYEYALEDRAAGAIRDALETIAPTPIPIMAVAVKVYQVMCPVCKEEFEVAQETFGKNLTCRECYNLLHVTSGEPPSNLDRMLGDMKYRLHVKKELVRDMNISSVRICLESEIGLLEDLILCAHAVRNGLAEYESEGEQE